MDDMEYHADYPHEPGTLYSCQACEENCYCDQLTVQCIACDEESE